MSCCCKAALRQASLKMQACLQVAGTSGKVQQTADEDAEGISSDAHGQAILEALGLERRNEVSSTAMPHSTLSPCATTSQLSLLIALIVSCDVHITTISSRTTTLSAASSYSLDTTCRFAPSCNWRTENKSCATGTRWCWLQGSAAPHIRPLLHSASMLVQKRCV